MSAEQAETDVPQQVVGVAVLADRLGGRVLLAARRTSPPELAGGWELPGGKCADGEDLAAAAVREIGEELGCLVRVTGALAGRTVIRPGLTLEVVTAVLESGHVVPTEHDEVRWLAATELESVAWLPADRPFLPQLRALLER